MSSPLSPPVTLLATAEAIAARAAEVRAAPVLPIDLESNGLHAYKPSLCILQIGLLDAAGAVREVLLVDPIAAGLEALAPLREAIGPTGPRKIVHDIAFDARILKQSGIPLGNVFDTALAARFLGSPASGLSTLVELHFGVKLSKALQHHDWGRRPLQANTLPYLATDVAYLLPLSQRFEAEAAKQGVTEDLAVETEYRLGTAAASDPDADPRPPYVRIKQSAKLDPLSLAILRELSEVREKESAKLDVPPFKVIGNEVLLTLAEKRPATLAATQAIPGLGRGRAGAIAGELFAALQRGLAAQKIPREEHQAFFVLPPRPPRELSQARKAREQRLSTWRKAEAARRKVDEQAVLPGHCLQELCDRAPKDLTELAEVAGLGAHRVTRDGNALLDAVAGITPAPVVPPAQQTLLPGL